MGRRVRAALDAAAERVELVERRRLEGIGQAVPDATKEEEGDSKEEGGEDGESKNKENKSAGEALADDADASVSAERSGGGGDDLFASSSTSGSSPLVVDVVQGVWPCDRLRGGGERAVAPLPRYPAFELLLGSRDDGDGKKGKKRGKSKGSSPSTSSASSSAAAVDEETPAESDVPRAERALAAEAEAAAVREFRARLAFNSGSAAAARAVLGKKKKSDGDSDDAGDDAGGGGGDDDSIIVAAKRSVSRAAVAPRRPEGGWPLLVKPLASSSSSSSKKKKKNKEESEPFVALPDGTTRPLTPRESAALKRATPLPRKRGIVS